MLKIIIGKLEKKKKKPKAWKASTFLFLFLFFLPLSWKGSRNPKIELKRLWIGVDSGTK